uniref:IAA-alanine resistance protein 1 n=1 Tax=Aegilops tauschii TaxID=37682 RepID=N1QXT8_AEGTA
MLCRLLSLLLLAALLAAAAGHGDSSASSCPFHGGHDEEPHEHHDHGHSCGGALDDSNHEHHHHHSHHHRDEIQRLLPEELAEEADLELEGFDHDHHHHHDHHHDHIHRDFQPESTPMVQGKPSKAVVDALAVFGMGDGLVKVDCDDQIGKIRCVGWNTVPQQKLLVAAALHLDLAVQAFDSFFGSRMETRGDASKGTGCSGGGHSHSHNHEDHDHAHEQSHAHSLKDLSVGLSILFGIVLFFIVEKIVRYVEDNSQRGGHSHGHHHHHHKRQDISDKAKSDHIKSDDEGKDTDQAQQNSLHDGATGKTIDAENEQESNATKEAVLGSQRSALDVVPGATDREPINSKTVPAPGKALSSEDPSVSNSNLVFGYLNLFSDGVHNFTDGMALGSAFLLHGSVGGWSRTLFLLAHELPQEIGDFGILVRSGFTVSKALFFNFLSALVALGGTALALSLGTDPGHSSLIEGIVDKNLLGRFKYDGDNVDMEYKRVELSLGQVQSKGFTAGGFIYIAVAGVLPQMHDQKTTLSNSMCQLIFLTMGMLVALGISLVE